MQTCDKEVAGAAARIEYLQFRCVLWPALKRARGRPPRPALAVCTASETQIFPADAGQGEFAAQFLLRLGAGGIIGIELLPRPPCAQRVVEQELHHVRLS